jgi:hypothetical protein
MAKYRELVEEAENKTKAKVQTDGWPSLAAAYRELQPNVSYAAFRARVLQGKSVVEAGTMPRSPRGRPSKQ